MTHSASDAHRTIQPVPTVPVLAAHPPAVGAERNDDSLRPVSGSDGFASDAIEAMHAGVPWEQRALSRRGILGWTIASMIFLFALIAMAAMMIARSGANGTVQGAAFVGSEVTGARPSPIPSASQATTTEAVVPAPPIPLEALPKVVAPKASQPARTALSHSKASPKKARKPLAVSARAPLVAPKAPALSATPTRAHN